MRKQQCQKKYQFFRRFEDGWAVRDMLASYLVNQVAVARLSIKKMKAAGADMRVSDCRTISHYSTYRNAPRVSRVRLKMRYQMTSTKKHCHHQRS
jgi:hypothetical protein